MPDLTPSAGSHYLAGRNPRAGFGTSRKSPRGLKLLVLPHRSTPQGSVAVRVDHRQHRGVLVWRAAWSGSLAMLLSSEVRGPKSSHCPREPLARSVRRGIGQLGNLDGAES